MILWPETQNFELTGNVTGGVKPNALKTNGAAVGRELLM
jgi:hypothetical protein